MQKSKEGVETASFDSTIKMHSVSKRIAILKLSAEFVTQGTTRVGHLLPNYSLLFKVQCLRALDLIVYLAY
jgi:hypothetical protein